MLTKEEIIAEALGVKFGFDDIGFTSAEPFTSQIEVLNSRKEEYALFMGKTLDLMKGIDPKSEFPEAKSIIVLMDMYFKESFPPRLEGHFGRCYLDDDRITQDKLVKKVKKFIIYLKANGINSSFPGNLPQRIAAARAGLGTFGKNCLLYSNKVARRGSWILPIPLVVDQEFEPDKPTMEIGCPDWCKNACIIACPTGALKGPRKLDPRKCISYLSYYGRGLTPIELREPMGMWVYGCDHCQNVCPRNRAWLAQDLPLNKRVVAKENSGDFLLPTLLHMNRKQYKTKVWPSMFYMSYGDLWRWKMNVARVMGNSLDSKYISDLVRAFKENKDERVKGMIAWSLGRIGGEDAIKALQGFLEESEGIVKDEILNALNN